MPKIYDNIDNKLQAGLSDALGVGRNAKFCVGYFNLRGWRQLSGAIDSLPGLDGESCQLLVGMLLTNEQALFRHYSGIEEAQTLEERHSV